MYFSGIGAPWRVRQGKQCTLPGSCDPYREQCRAADSASFLIPQFSSDLPSLWCRSRESQDPGADLRCRSYNVIRIRSVGSVAGRGLDSERREQDIKNGELFQRKVSSVVAAPSFSRLRSNSAATAPSSARDVESLLPANLIRDHQFLKMH
jgi:hypothetical protein